MKDYTFAILVPSYKRKDDLIFTVTNTPLCGIGKFIVVANYEKEEYEELQKMLEEKAVFVNEREYGKLGASGAFNLAYKKSVELGFDYSILYADDVVPFDNDWLQKTNKLIKENNVQFGIFSSDECHSGTFGWNIIKNAPIAHFFVIQNGLVSYLFDKAYKQYVIDFEIGVRLIKNQVPVHLLPIRLNHLRSHLHRESMVNNYLYDSEIFYRHYPEYCIYMDKIMGKKYLPDSAGVVNMKDIKKYILYLYPGVISSPVKIFVQTLKGYVKYLVIKISFFFNKGVSS